MNGDTVVTIHNTVADALASAEGFSSAERARVHTHLRWWEVQRLLPAVQFSDPDGPQFVHYACGTEPWQPFMTVLADTRAAAIVAARDASARLNATNMRLRPVGQGGPYW